MKYALVLQWPMNSIRDYDVMVGFETALIDALRDGSEIDGHDAGSGEMNIFISTDRPAEAFAELKVALVAHDLFTDIRVAYRSRERRIHDSLASRPSELQCRVAGEHIW